jgi:hypothetical protein
MRDPDTGWQKYPEGAREIEQLIGCGFPIATP